MTSISPKNPQTTLSWAQNGIVNMLAAAAFFALMAGAARFLGHHFPSVELMFFRNVVGVFILFASFRIRPIQQTGGKTGLLIFRGLIGTMALFGFFYNVTHVQIAIATTYNLTYPIFIAFISATILRIRVPAAQWLAILIGFGGILFIFRPDVEIPLKNHLLGLWSGFGAGLAYLAINRLGQYYDTRVTVLSFMVSGLILPVIGTSIGHLWYHPQLDFLLAPFVWPLGWDWFWLGMLGIFAMMGQIFVTRALSFGKPTVVGPINYMQIPFSILISVPLGDAFPDIWVLLGIGLVISSGVLITATHSG